MAVKVVADLERGEHLKDGRSEGKRVLTHWRRIAVEITAGPYFKPTFKKTLYVGCCSLEEAVRLAKQQLWMIAIPKPRRPRFSAREATPFELGARSNKQE